MQKVEWNIGDVCIDVDSCDIHFVINTKGLTKWWSNKNNKWIDYTICESELDGLDIDCFSYPQKYKLLNILYGIGE